MSFFDFLSRAVITIAAIVLAVIFVYSYAFEDGRNDVRKELQFASTNLAYLKEHLSENKVLPYGTKVIIEDIENDFRIAGVLPKESRFKQRYKKDPFTTYVKDGFFKIKRGQLFELSPNRTPFIIVDHSYGGSKASITGSLGGIKFKRWSYGKLSFKSDNKACTIVLFGIKTSRNYRNPDVVSARLACE